MKRLIICAVMLLALQGVAMAQMTNHPRYAVIDTLVKSLITKVQIAQATFFAANQEYFQGILTPSFTVDGMTDAVPNWAVTPSDRIASWKTFDPTTFKTNFKIPFQIEISVEESNDGWAWVLMIHIWKDGLGPDEFGHEGPHWFYQHYEGPASGQIPAEYVDKWMVRRF